MKLKTMSILKKNKPTYSRSYVSVLDLFKPTSVCVLCDSRTKVQQVFHTSCGEAGIRSKVYKVHSKCTKYLTSDSGNIPKEDSSKASVPSASTIFYDLDDIAKRHSFHCITEFDQSNTNLLKVMRINVPNNTFFSKSNATAQECSTQMHRKLLPRDSIEINSKKVKKKYSKNQMSSEIFLRDDDYLHDYERNYYNNNLKDMRPKPQKFWSYAKYRTEYTKPEDKKVKKNDKGKRTENPCPCQLFSYACPCTDEKSLTELAGNKTLTVNNQITSTTKIVADENVDVKLNYNKTKKHKRDTVRDDKPTNTSVAELIEVMVPRNELVTEMEIQHDTAAALLIDQNNNTKNNKKNHNKSRKKCRRILCPNCKEKVDVVISVSTTEEEESLKYENSILNEGIEEPTTTTYNYRSSPTTHQSKITDEDLCLHEPPCEMLPICQILPTDYYTVNPKCMKKNSAPKSTPRIIRITKACRHHPPCTVVPSCQRANVLKNNCEYIPPCLHHPRCVNLPLCVPFSKSMHYEESPTKLVDYMGKLECPHIPKCKYFPVCQHDSLSNIDPHQINMVSQIPNACEVFNTYNPILVNPKTNCIRNTCSPCQLSTVPCHACRSHKSCQFNFSRTIPNTNDNVSSDDIIFIRDVGCQFRSKSYSPKNSMLQSTESSNSFELVDVKQMNNYYTNIHTLRYEDKFTNPISTVERSYSADSITSIDSVCPSHGRRASPYSRRIRPTTGFQPQSAYITAFSTRNDPNQIHCVQINKSNMEEIQDRHRTFSVKSRRNFLKGKYKSMYLIRRKRKPRLSTKMSRKSSVYQ